MRDDLTAQTLTINGAGGEPIEAYAARPLSESSRGGIVVIHHLPGYDAASKEIVRRFAALGYDVVMPNLFHREAPGADPDDAAAAGRARGGVPDERLVGDVSGGLTFLRAQPSATGRTGVIGFCSGGRQSVLAACELPVDAAVDCYGAFVTRHSPDDFPVTMVPLVDRLPRLRSPLLGLFGAEDSNPSPTDTAELERILAEHGKQFDHHTYDDAGHAFLAVDRPSYRPQQAVDAWSRITDFFGRHVGAAS